MANKHRTDVEYDMAVEYPMLKISGYYKAVSFHRNGTPDKSQWIISMHLSDIDPMKTVLNTIVEAYK